MYPYFIHIKNKQNIDLVYNFFTKQGNNEVGYQKLFNTMLNSLYTTLGKVGASNVKVVMSESG